MPTLPRDVATIFLYNPPILIDGQGGRVKKIESSLYFLCSYPWLHAARGVCAFKTILVRKNFALI